MTAPYLDQLPDLVAQCRRLGVTDIAFGEQGQIVRLSVLPFHYAPPEDKPESPKTTTEQMVAAVEDEDAKRARKQREWKAYERVAFAATEGLPADEDGNFVTEEERT